MNRSVRASLGNVTGLWGLDAVGALCFAFGLAGAIGSLMRPGASLAGFAAIAVIGGVMRAIGSGGAGLLGVSMARDEITRLRRTFLSRSMSKAGFRLASRGERNAAVIGEGEAQEGYLAHYQPLRQAAVVGPVVILVAVAFASWVSALILIATLVPLIVMLALVGMAAKDAADRQFLALERLSARFADRIRALPLILAFQAEDREAAVVAQSAAELSEQTLSVLRIAFLSSAALEFFAAVAVALVAVYQGFSLLGLLPIRAPEHVDLARAVFVLALAPEFYLPLRRLAAAYHDKQVGEAAAARLDLSAAEVPTASRIPAMSAPAEIAFEDVVIAYDAGAVVGPVSFVAERGRSTVLLGATGSGKSSLLKLVVGLTQCTSGRITVDGQAFHPVDGDTLPLAWVGQAPMILPLSIGENIALARPGACRADVERAALEAGLGPVLRARSLGLDAQLDERGSGLSGGERRRIAMARAMLKAAPIVVLDEPTADLDAQAEDEFISLIGRLAEGRTVLIATHSAALAATADKVVRLT